VAARLRGIPVQRLAERAWQRVVARWPRLLGTLRAPARQRQTVDVAHWDASVSAGTPDTPAVDPAEALRALREEHSWRERRRAITLLAEARGDDVTEALVGAIRDPSAEVAVAAIDALAGHASPAGLAALQAVVDDVDGYFASVTRAAAIAGLAAAGGEAATPSITRAVRDLDAEVSLSAIAAIGEHLPHEAEAALVPVLQDRSGFFLPIVRLAAARALSQAGAVTTTLRDDLLTAEQDPSIRSALTPPS
jgi:HEAT repeat protein